jgi:hypothetical protein
MKLLIEIPEKMYHMINTGQYDYGDMNVIIQNGIPLDKIKDRISLEKLGYPPSAGYYIAIDKVLQIIDKYKAKVSHRKGAKNESS